MKVLVLILNACVVGNIVRKLDTACYSRRPFRFDKINNVTQTPPILTTINEVGANERKYVNNNYIYQPKHFYSIMISNLLLITYANTKDKEMKLFTIYTDFYSV